MSMISAREANVLFAASEIGGEPKRQVRRLRSRIAKENRVELGRKITEQMLRVLKARWKGRERHTLTSIILPLRYRLFVYCSCICLVTASVTFGWQWPTRKRLISISKSFSILTVRDIVDEVEIFVAVLVNKILPFGLLDQQFLFGRFVKKHIRRREHIVSSCK